MLPVQHVVQQRYDICQYTLKAYCIVRGVIHTSSFAGVAVRWPLRQRGVL